MEQDLSKFEHLLGFLWGKRFDPLMISIDSNGEVEPCIYGAYSVYNDGKGHSGMCLTMDKGTMMHVSKKIRSYYYQLD